MENYLNTINCTDGSQGNTGVPKCGKKIGKFSGLIVTDASKTYDKTALATFIANLQADVLVTGNNRIFPLLNIIDLPTNNTAETAYNTTGYGFIDKGKEGIPDFSFKYQDFGVSYYKKLRKLNGTGKRAFVDDKDNKILWGKKNSAGDFVGFKLSLLDFQPVKIGTGSDSNEYMVRTVFGSASDLTDDITYFDYGSLGIDSLGDEISGLYDVLLDENTPSSGQVDMLPIVELTGDYLAETFGTELLEVGAWSCINALGVSIAPTAASITNGISLTLAAGTYTISLVNPTALEVLGIGSSAAGGFESNSVTVVIPA